MGDIAYVKSIPDTKTALLDLVRRIELIERSLKIRTIEEQETSPLRTYLKSLGILGI